MPVRKKIRLKYLKKHLYMLPEYPERIPYVTSYYKKNWGFCISQDKYNQLKDGMYEVYIDSNFKKGSLSYGELLIKGKSDKEILFSCYTCHPSLCNDNLSGIGLLTFIAKNLLNKKLKYSYRFLFIPETIGAITWLSLNEKTISKIRGGLIATCLGDAGMSTYKKTRKGDELIDKIAEKVLIDSKAPYKIIDFNPACGSDERQFCSPALNLPIGSLMRTPYDEFTEYHTSADNLDFIRAESIADTCKKYLDVIYILENDVKYINLFPNGEPQLGKRGLYRAISRMGMSVNENAIFWVLNYSDGENSLLDISISSGLNFREIKFASDILKEHSLLRRIDENPS